MIFDDWLNAGIDERSVVRLAPDLSDILPTFSLRWLELL